MRHIHGGRIHEMAVSHNDEYLLWDGADRDAVCVGLLLLLSVCGLLRSI